MLRERKRYRKTGRQTDGLAGKQAETDRHSDFNSRDREMVRVRQTDIQTETDRHSDFNSRDRWSEADRHTFRLRQTDIQTETGRDKDDIQTETDKD